MRIALLGPLEVTDDAGRPVEVGGTRLRTLLILLALEAGRVVTTERLIDGIWGDDPPSGAPNALQSLVSRLRRTVPGIPIDSHAAGYRLAVASEAVDVHEFGRLAARGRDLLRDGDPDGAAGALARALRLWRGPALADVADADFARGHVARLTEQRLGATEDHIEARLRLGRADPGELRSLVAAHPLRERLRGQYMRALSAAGRQAEALAAFEDARRTLAEELGVDPSPELQAVHLAVLRGEPAGPARGPARTNLRARLTSFIGREEELERVGKLLEENRLVTLTGPGGAGKTRLAVEAAERFIGRMPGGVWLVELAPVGDPAEVPQVMLTALGLREAALVPDMRGKVLHAEPIDRLVAALSGERLLIVLDNCEHLVEACARIADRVLADCPGVRILATSREALGIIGETLWPVPPLAFPGDETPPGDVLSYPAVRLLAERGAAVRPDFTVEADPEAVLAICRRLDGMPLAIELAAARLRTMTAARIADRLDDRFRLLTGGSRIALPRHQTLRAVVDWSWDLLDEAEQVLLRRLSVFSGGATLEAIEEVCGGDVLDALTGLVEKSLAGVDETGRYRLLETIRAYGTERLVEAGESTTVRRAHARYFLALAETAEPLLRTRDQMRWLRRLATEHDNVHSALRWAIDVGDAALAVRFVAALGWYWFLSGHRAEIRQLSREAVGLPGDAPSEPRALALLYHLLGEFGHDPAEFMDEGRRRFTAALDACAAVPRHRLHPLLQVMPMAIEAFVDGRMDAALTALEDLETAHDPWLGAFATMMRGHLRINIGRVDGTEEILLAALAAFRDLGERWGLSMTLTGLAELTLWRGEPRLAKTYIEEALGHSMRFGSHDDASHLRGRLAQAYTALGDDTRARAELEAAIRAAERRGGAAERALIRSMAADIARRDGDLAKARRLLEEAARHIPESAPPQFAALVNSRLGVVHVLEGDLGAARARHTEAFRLACGGRDAPVVAEVLVGFADLALRTGDPVRAATLLGAAAGVRGVEDRSLPDPPRIAKAAREAIGEERFAEAYARGRAMGVPEAADHLGIDLPDRDAVTW